VIESFGKGRWERRPVIEISAHLGRREVFREITARVVAAEHWIGSQAM
jgi:hypothetical protein